MLTRCKTCGKVFNDVDRLYYPCPQHPEVGGGWIHEVPEITVQTGTKSESEEYLDAAIADALSKAPEARDPDFYMVVKTKPDNRVYDMPLACFKTKEALYSQFDSYAYKNGMKVGVSIVLWWFDDK